MTRAAADVAVVVVAHNSAADLPDCLASVRAEGAAELVVVDNDSADDSAAVAAAHGARVVVNAENEGFAAAVNAGVAATAAPVVFLLNPDAVLHSGALEAVAGRLASDPGVGAVGPRVEHRDGTLQASCRSFPSIAVGAAHGFLGLFWSDNPVSRRYTMADWDHTTARDVDWVSGCAVAISRDAFTSVDGFDPAYFMYVEDVDFCWRLHRHGWRVVYDPAAVVTHAIGTSSGLAPFNLVVEHHRSMLRFERVRRGGRRGLTWPLIVVGVWARAAVALARRAIAGARPAAHHRIEATVAAPEEKAG
ncbi:MAG: glycosyltransferase family 2 protein [Acidimicrobiia bacterium]|nr:glycosyltransferase family 2 protein [Acidimicrobiia bacterium]